MPRLPDHVDRRRLCVPDRSTRRRGAGASAAAVEPERRRPGRNVPMTAGHVALLGGSIFDNRAYTGGEPDVVTHLRDLLPHGWRTTLYAVDGATTADIPRQAAPVAAH